MSKTATAPSVNLLKLLNFMTTGAILYFFAILARAEDVILFNDGSVSKRSAVVKSYKNLADVFNNSPTILQGESVDRFSCVIKIQPPQEIYNFTSKHGFTIFAAKPMPPLDMLIKDVPIVFSGKAKNRTKQVHAAMVRKILPTIGNHQLLARVLANPKFKFVIDYSDGLRETLNLPGALAATHNDVIMITLRPILFIEESFLLGLLRNEFASMHAIIANDCRIGSYDKTLGNRASPIALYLLPEKFPGMTLSQERIDIKMNEFFDAMENAYATLLRSKKLYLLMNVGKAEKTIEYKKFESYLATYIPAPINMPLDPPFKKNQIDAVSARNRARGNVFDVIGEFYILPKSYQGDDNFYTSSQGFVGDPHSIFGKMTLFYDQLLAHRELTIDSKSPEYATRSYASRYAEWLSYLEQDYSPDFLKFLFSAYCEHMTEYTQLDAEYPVEERRNYCGF